MRAFVTSRILLRLPQNSLTLEHGRYLLESKRVVLDGE